jgi:hypothetical protein
MIGFLGFFPFIARYAHCVYLSEILFTTFTTLSVSSENKFVKMLSFTLCLHQIGYMQNNWFESEILGYFFR